MLGIELFMTGWLHLAASTVECKPRKSPVVSVIPSNSRVKYNFSKSQADLDDFDIDTVSPYGPHQETHVGGLMSGEIKVEHQINFVHENYPGMALGCLHYDQIDVKIHIDPTIYVASEYPKGTCKHDAILGHEKKHLKVDRWIVNKYSKDIGKSIQKALNKHGFVYGPFKEEDMGRAQERLQNYITDIVNAYSDKMNQERREKQQAVDNIEEYERVQNMCQES